MTSRTENGEDTTLPPSDARRYTGLKRNEGEFFWCYKVRRELGNMLTKAKCAGRIFWPSSLLGTYKKSVDGETPSLRGAYETRFGAISDSEWDTLCGRKRDEVRVPMEGEGRPEGSGEGDALSGDDNLGSQE